MAFCCCCCCINICCSICRRWLFLFLIWLRDCDSDVCRELLLLLIDTLTLSKKLESFPSVSNCFLRSSRNEDFWGRRAGGDGDLRRAGELFRFLTLSRLGLLWVLPWPPRVSELVLFLVSRTSLFLLRDSTGSSFSFFILPLDEVSALPSCSQTSKTSNSPNKREKLKLKK